MKIRKITIRLTCAAALSSALCLLGACSKTPPPQPPVVINLNNPASLTRPEGPTPSQPCQKSVQQPLPQPSSTPPAVQPCPNNIQAAKLHDAPQTRPCLEVENMDEASFFNMQIHEMALQLMRNFRTEPGPDGPIAVATFVDLNNLYRTSPFGRYLAEQLMGELQRAGFNIVEIRKTESIMIKPKFGEYGLSRDVQEIAQESSASYILAGTYVTRGRYIMVNARLISNQNNLIASSGLKILRRDPFLDKMLWPATTPASGHAVRIPVKELGQMSDIKILSES